jgi:glycosyltransferase involved in cell wall biosynthesis
MSRRLKVLLSAYACEPNKGSEPEVGWQWALQMARFHDVTVLTRANNQASIEKELANLRGTMPLPRFLYHDEDSLIGAKKRLNAAKSYYIVWQRSAHKIIEQLNAERHFDLLHHVTFAAYRYPTAIWNHGVPAIWGPIGGIESIPFQLLPWHHGKSLFHEIVRNIHNSLQSLPLNVLPKRARQSAVVLVSTREMQRVFSNLNVHSILMPTIGLRMNPSEPMRQISDSGPLKLLFVGNIITLKGADLALEALRKSGTSAQLTFVGDGNFLASAKKFVSKSDLSAQVHFVGRLPREKVMEVYPHHDVFLFPSLHDTGGYAVIEAMSKGLPVICLDCGGPAVAVEENCGFKIPLGSRAAVVDGLSEAIRFYETNRKKIEEHGRFAREAVFRNYDWNQKGLQMNEVYNNTASDNQRVWRKSVSGADVLKAFSLKGLFLTALILLTLGVIGFFSIQSLKQQSRSIVVDTLPGLSYAGAANANLTETFNQALLFLESSNAHERAVYKQQMREFSDYTGELLEKYRTNIFSKQDMTNFNLLIEKRNAYLEVREKFVALVEQNRRDAALEFYKHELLPSYNGYRNAGEVLLDFNIREGKTRGTKIMLICTITQWTVAIFVILIFIVGFVLGFFR